MVDQTQRPLRIPLEYSEYAEKHQLFELFRYLTEKLVIHRPDDPLPFLVKLLRLKDVAPPQIVIFGPPCSGKLTLARCISDDTSAVVITLPRLLHRAETDVKEKIMSHVKQNVPLPKEIIVKLIQDRVIRTDCMGNGYIITGLVETKEQLCALQAAGVMPSHFVFVESPPAVLMERALGKRVDPVTKEVYHLTYDAPKIAEVTARLQIPNNYSNERLLSRFANYNRYIPGIKARLKPDTWRAFNADQPKYELAQEIEDFVKFGQRSVAPYTPRVLLLGPPGSGKRTQASLLCSKYDLVELSFDTLMKQAAMRTDSRAELINDQLSVCNQLSDLPDNIVLDVISERIQRNDCTIKGWVMHGFPRNAQQAEELQQLECGPNRVFFLQLPEQACLQRILERRIDPVTGHQFHLTFKPAPTSDTQQRLITHEDDKEDIVRMKLKEFGLNELGLHEVFNTGMTIMADTDQQTVMEELESRIVRPPPKKLKHSPDGQVPLATFSGVA